MRRIEIYDTTLRDGSQGEGVNFSLEDKLAITRRLDEAGVDFIEGGYPLSNPKDAQYFERVRSFNLAHSRVVAFGMPRRRVMPKATTREWARLKLRTRSKYCASLGLESG